MSPDENNKQEMMYVPEGQVVRANEDGSIRFKLVTKDVDRKGSVILPEGAKIENYVKNPVWLWCHNIESWGGLMRPPIGRVNTKTISIGPKAFEEDVFFDEKHDYFASLVAAKHRSGFLNACSIGMIPLEIDDKPRLKGQTGPTYVSYDVLEGSSVPIPANQKALQVREWYEFLEAAEKNGFEKDQMQVWLQMAGWGEYEIKEALPDKDKVYSLSTFEDDKVHDIASGGLILPEMNIEIGNRAVVPYKKFELAPEGTAWSFNASDKNKVLGDPPDWKKYKSVHSWYDDKKTEIKASYKLPVAKDFGGTIKVVWKGVAAAMAALLGARGGTKIPSGEKKGVYDRLVKYYKDFGKKPPEFRMMTESELELFISWATNEASENMSDVLSNANFMSEWSDTILALWGMKVEEIFGDSIKLSEPFDEHILIAEASQRIVFLQGELRSRDIKLSTKNVNLLIDIVDAVIKIFDYDEGIEETEFTQKLVEIKEKFNKEDKKDEMVELLEKIDQQVDNLQEAHEAHTE